MSATKDLLAIARKKLDAHIGAGEAWAQPVSDALSVLEERSEFLDAELVYGQSALTHYLQRMIDGDQDGLFADIAKMGAEELIAARQAQNDELLRIIERNRAREMAWREVASKLGQIGMRVALVALQLA